MVGLVTGRFVPRHTVTSAVDQNWSLLRGNMKRNSTLAVMNTDAYLSQLSRFTPCHPPPDLIFSRVKIKFNLRNIVGFLAM
jgi:hypothetical protein